MDEEEVQQPKQKINIDSFFNRIDEVDEVANKALKQSSSNLSTINANKTLIQSISVSIDAMRTEIRDIATYIVVEQKLEKDLKEDRLLEEEDKEQKKKMSDRNIAMGEQGPKGDKGDPAPEEKSGGFMGGIMKLVGGLGLIAGLSALAVVAAPILIPLMIGGIAAAAIYGISKVVPKIFKSLGNRLGKGIGDTSKATIGRVPLIGKPVNNLADKLGGSLSDVTNKLGDKLETGLKSSAKSLESGGKGDVSVSVEGGTGGGGGAGGVDAAKEIKESDVDTSDQNLESDNTTGEGGVDVSKNLESDQTKNKGDTTLLEADQEQKKGFLKMLGGLGDVLKPTPSSEMSGIRDTRRGRGARQNVKAPKQLPQVSSAEIKGTGTTISYVRALQNPHLSINNRKLPPEVARMIQ